MAENDPLSALRELVASMRESEEIYGRQVDVQRHQERYYRESARISIGARGYSDAIFDLIAAHAKARAAAETSFDAAVHVREAMERLIAELESQLGSHG